jgi:hypothetical protein
MVLRADIMYRIDQCGNIVRVYVRCYAVTQVEYMAVTMTEIREYAADFLPDDLRVGRHDGWIHITLQCNPVTDLLAGEIDIYRPVQANTIATGISDLGQPHTAAFGE